MATTTAVAGQRTDEGDSRIFPCEGCGADLEFKISQQALTCPYCGFTKSLQIGETVTLGEQDLKSMLQKLSGLRAKGVTVQVETKELRCDSCGGTVVFSGTLTSTECPYCASPIQRNAIHDSVERVPVDGVLPFKVERGTAQASLKKWVKSRWFAPNEFKKRGAHGKFSGVYMPYWTFDAMTSNAYSGERGEYYYVSVGSGAKRRKVRRTRWYRASGHFNKFFDDVLVCAGSGLPDNRTQALEPWPLEQCVPFTQEVLAGLFARTYDVPLATGFKQGRERIDASVRAEARRQIGGDTQRVHSVNSQYSAVTYKHLLLPVWLMAYRFNQKVFQVIVNAASGEVVGDRPYSVVKMVMAVLGGLLGLGAFLWLASLRQ